MVKRNIGRGAVAGMVFALSLIIAMGCYPLLSAEAGDAPSVSITPSSGAPGDALEITGHGFEANEEIDIVLILGEGMRIGLGTTKVEVVVADPDGSFSASSAIPKMAKPGEYKIEVIGSEGSEASATLTVTSK